jgi:hypothetical protein
MGNNIPINERYEAVSQVLAKYSITDIKGNLQKYAMDGDTTVLAKYLDAKKDLVFLKDNVITLYMSKYYIIIITNYDNLAGTNSFTLGCFLWSI